LVDTSTFESATDQPSWFQGHPLLRVEYAAALASSAEYRQQAERQLESALFADPSLARAYELLGRLRLAHGEAERALLPLRLASTLKKSDDGAARSYVQGLLAANREREAIAWLQRRIEDFADHALAAPTWIALIDLYDALGRADETLRWRICGATGRPLFIILRRSRWRGSSGDSTTRAGTRMLGSKRNHIRWRRARR
jgi:tetratricopeptide (TPR) repeat protein